MPEYRVSIDVEARTPYEAAKLALMMLQDKAEHPTVYTVRNLNSGAQWEIDLAPGKEW